MFVGTFNGGPRIIFLPQHSYMNSLPPPSPAIAVKNQLLAGNQSPALSHLSLLHCVGCSAAANDLDENIFSLSSGLLLSILPSAHC